MKIAFTTLLVLTSIISSFGQDTLKKNNTDSLSTQEGFDFYVIQSGDLYLSIDHEEKTSEMEMLDPSWIESITLYKAADARLKYGEKATDGVIIIDLTKAGFSKLPTALRYKFKKLTPQ